MKIKNSQLHGQLHGITFILILILILFACLYLFIVIMDARLDNDCFKKIANDFCKSINQENLDIYWSFGYYFECAESSRAVEGICYEFMDEEIERCLEK